MVFRSARGGLIYCGLGAFHLVFWNLFQANGYKGFQIMTTTTLAFIGIVVFCLMLTGLYLSVREFLQTSDDPSQMKGIDREVASD